MDTRHTITEKARSLGFDAVGFTAPELGERARARMMEFVENGEHGDMGWMADKAHLRADPKALWPEARTLVMLGHNYGPAENPLPKLSNKGIGLISAYAQHRDYHDVMKKRMRELAGWMCREFNCDAKIFVDTAPIMEKPLAEKAGLGWIGKHTCLVSREYGSWLFLGEIFTDLVILSDSEGSTKVDSSPAAQNDSVGNCGTCTRCLDICPTSAFTSCGKLDARKCIAYLTIEHKGQIPEEFRKAMGNRVYGCDDCLAVCPWNKFAQESQEAAYHAREDLKEPPLASLLVLDDAQFRAKFSGSPVKRLGRDRFVRNVLVAAGNSEDTSLLPLIAPLTSDANPLVAEMAAWALGQLRSAAA